MRRGAGFASLLIVLGSTAVRWFEVLWSVSHNEEMKNHLGFMLQFAALVFLPVLIIFQLNWGFQLLYMPMLTLAGLGMFYLGHLLRDRAS